MQDYEKLVRALRHCSDHLGGCTECPRYDAEKARKYFGCGALEDAAAAIEELQAEVKRLQDKLCDWCAVCPKERRRPEDCELLGENPVMYGPSGAKMEVQDETEIQG